VTKGEDEGEVQGDGQGDESIAGQGSSTPLAQGNPGGVGVPPPRRAFSVAVYARRDDRVLVIEHRRLRTWLPVGGELTPGETPLEAARRELREETGLSGRFRPLEDALDGVPPGFIGYEEHPAGAKGVHLNFVFVTEVDTDAEVLPNHEFTAWRWVNRSELDRLESPKNVRQFGVLALEARFG
jgi:8-oxo-dGTP diphosphatase